MAFTITRPTAMKKVLIVVAIAVLGGVATIAVAHHAAQAQFDLDGLQSFAGVLTKFEMINPHPQLYFSVEIESGTVENWRVEAPSVAALRRIGILRALNIGDTYSIEYAPSRDGSLVALMSSLTDSEGTRYGVTGVNFPRRSDSG